jgi:hypothetical protein
LNRRRISSSDNLGWGGLDGRLGMAKIGEIVEQVKALLAGEISLEAFEDWSADYSWDIHRQPNAAAMNLAYQIRGILNAHADDLSDDVVRQELAGAIRPFAGQFEIAWKDCEGVAAEIATGTHARPVGWERGPYASANRPVSVAVRVA